MKKTPVYISFFIFFLLCACSADAAITSTSATVDIFAMDTYMTITAYGSNAKNSVDAIEKLVYQLDRQWSVNNPESEISILNETKQANISDYTKDILAISDKMYTLTGGAFNIATFPIVKLWGFTTGNYQIPNPADIDEAILHLNPSVIEIDANRAYINDAYVQLGLGAVAKGYTTDLIRDILVEYDIPSAIVSLGGNIYAHGTLTGGSPWNVAIQSPFDVNKHLGTLEAADTAVITSGAYDRCFEADGKIYHHIIDPETGFPADSGVASITIVCENAAMADALSTAVFVMGLEKGIDFWRENEKSFDMIFVTEDKKLYISENIEPKFKLLDKSFEIFIIE